MAGWRPLKRREFVRRLLRLGFAGPFRGTRRDYLTFGPHRQTIPSKAEYSWALLMILVQPVVPILGHLDPASKWESL